jgi:hypothetical protein
MKSFLKSLAAVGPIRALLGFNAIALIYLVRLKPRLFIQACQSAFLASRRQETMNALSAIPEIHLGEILGDRRPLIKLSVMRSEDGMLPNDQIMAVLAILVAENPSEVLEIGTFMGYSSRQMAENLDTATIHTVDLPEDFSPDADPHPDIPKDDVHLMMRRVVGREFKERPCASRIRQHFTDTAVWDFHEAGHPTFFFIDGSHTYEYCKNDSEKCFALSGGKGTFLWHDCDDAHPGVVQFVMEWRQQGRDIRRIAGTPIAYWKSA